MSSVTLKDGTVLPVEILTSADLPDIKQLQTEVIGHLKEKDFLQPLTDEEFRYILQGNGFIAGVRASGRLIAFRAMLDPGEDPEHLGEDAGIPKAEWPSVLYSEITNVDPDFQGNGLQRQLGRIVMDAVDCSKYRYICTTVSPYNIASIKDKFELGMHIAALSVKYDVLTRYIMVKDLAQKVSVSAGDQVEISMGNIEEQQRLLKDRWIGTQILPRDDDWMVRFQPLAD